MWKQLYLYLLYRLQYNGGGTTYTTVDADGKLRFVLTCSEDGSKWLAADGAPVAGPVGCFG